MTVAAPTGLPFKVSYSHAYKGMMRDSYPNLNAVIADDVQAFASRLLLEVFAGDIRYYEMLGITGWTASYYAFHWYEYLEALGALAQYFGALWAFDSAGMAELELWSEA